MLTSASVGMANLVFDDRHHGQVADFFDVVRRRTGLLPIFRHHAGILATKQRPASLGPVLFLDYPTHTRGKLFGTTLACLPDENSSE